MKLQISDGRSHPLGPAVVKTEKYANGYEYQTVNIAVLARVPNVSICLFAPLHMHDVSVIRDIEERIDLIASEGAVHHVQLSGVPRGSSYAIHVRDGGGKSRLLTDPYAPCVESNGADSWMRVAGENYKTNHNNQSGNKNWLAGTSRNVREYIRSFTTLRALGIEHPFRPARFELPKDALEFKWTTNSNKSLSLSATKTSFADTILYEAHARALAPDGTLESAAERAPYLRWLGVTAVQLLPVFEFAEADVSATGGEEFILNLSSDKNDKMLSSPLPSERRGNHWGYAPLSFFAPMNRYSRQRIAGGPLALKTFVNAMHQHNIQVILDVVYNHTADSSCAFHFLNVQKDYYLEVHPQHISQKNSNSSAAHRRNKFKGHSNLSACGNTLSPNALYTMQLIIGSMRHFVIEYHVDGFRLDAAGILCRDERGEPTNNPAIIQQIASDDVLRDAVLIVEGWDAGDQMGSPNMLLGRFPYGERFREWNPAWRDAVRTFMRGVHNNNTNRELATIAQKFREALCGYRNLFVGRPDGAAHGVNFVSCHDGLCLADVVSYCHRTNTDGYDGEVSFNCGYEGSIATSDAAEIATKVEKNRCKQIRNLLTALAVSRGVPMILQGDELGFSKQGNSNSWNCPTTFMCTLPDMPSTCDTHEYIVLFARTLFHLRKRHSQLTGVDFYDDITWVDSHGLPIREQDLNVTAPKNPAHIKDDPDTGGTSSSSAKNLHPTSERGNNDQSETGILNPGSITDSISVSDCIETVLEDNDSNAENAYFVAFVTPSLQSITSDAVHSEAVFVAFNNSTRGHEIILPQIPQGKQANWTLEIDTHLFPQMIHQYQQDMVIDKTLPSSSRFRSCSVFMHAQSALIYSAKS